MHTPTATRHFVVYVPAGDTYGIDPRSAIVAAEPDEDSDHITVYFEGNRYHAIVLGPYVGRLACAAERCATNYPTVAMARLPRSALIEVARFDLEDCRFVGVTDLESLAAWLEDEPLPQALIELQATKDYQTVAGRIVHIHRADCEPRGGGELVTVSFDPPALGRIIPYRAGDTAMLKRWTDDGHCDPIYQVELVEWHPELWHPDLAERDLNPAWCYGRSWSVDGKAEDGRDADVVLADEATQARLASAPGLRFGEPEIVDATPTSTLTARERALWAAALQAAQAVCEKRREAHAVLVEPEKAEAARQCAVMIGTWLDASDEQIEDMLREHASPDPAPGG